MKAPSNHELHIILTKMDGKIDIMHEKLDGVSSWQEKHAESDEKHFETINNKIGNMQGIAATVGIFSAGIGAFISYMWNRFTGHA